MFYPKSQLFLNPKGDDSSCKIDGFMTTYISNKNRITAKKKIYPNAINIPRMIKKR